MAQAPSNLFLNIKILDGFSKFDAGMNSGIAPLDLPKNQLGYALNATMRGNFVTDRPPYRKLVLDFGNDSVLQAVVVSALFQGGCYFRPDIGTESLIMAIAGHLFRFAISGTTAVVTEITIPGDANPSTTPQAWLWQSEKWVIWNDGVSKPIFYDGVSSRRSIYPAIDVGTTNAPAVAPVVGSSVSLSLATNYAGPLNQTIFVGSRKYQILATLSAYNVALQNITGTPAGTVVTGTPLNIQPGSLGKTSLAFTIPTPVPTITLRNLNATPATTIQGGSLMLPHNSLAVLDAGGMNVGFATPYVGAAHLVAAPPLGSAELNTFFIGGIPFTGSAFAISGKDFTATITDPNYPHRYFGPGSALIKQINPPANYGSISEAITVPAIGATVTVAVSQAYIDPVNKVVYFGANAAANQFEVVSTGGTQGNFNVTSDLPALVNTANQNLIIGGHSYHVNSVISDSTINVTPNSTDLPAGTVVGVNAIITNSPAPPNYPIGHSLGYNDGTDHLGSWTIPAVGASITVILDTAYTGPLNQLVWIGDTTYKITAAGGSAPTTTVNAVNVDDTPGAAIATGTKLRTIPEMPPGRMGAYGLGRNAFALADGHTFMLGDIVGGSSGSPAQLYRDAVLRITENSFLAGGGTFPLPNSGGEIRAMAFRAVLDTGLGQGPLAVFTTDIVFSCKAPIERADWQNVTNPILTQSIISNGAQGQNGVVAANSDLVFRSVDGIRSEILAKRDFSTWGNVPISREVDPTLNLDTKSLLQFASAIVFDNRLLMTAEPAQGPLGTYHSKLIALNFDPISSLAGKAASIYDGIWSGLNILRLFKGKFAGIERAFGWCYNATTNQNELWELQPTGDDHFDNDTTPIAWEVQFPVLQFPAGGRNERELLRLEDGELYVDDIQGNVSFEMFYRPDFDPEWHPWYAWNVSQFPSWQPTMGLGSPAKEADAETGRPSKEGYCFQMKLVVRGHCRLMGGRFRAVTIPQPEFAKQLPVNPE